ncbi:MAG: cadmium-translocating P-type ATPase [Clostridiales bacterium]|nr:cadmium-translocating P-type ATPase [Clostridiales bacterium]MBP3811224.1 cadmium-translocating P-type ATPase [Clostridiales bacterium]
MKFKLTRKQKKMLYRIIAAGILLAAAAVITHFTDLPWWANLLIYVVPYVVSGYDVLKTAAVNLLHGQVFDEKFLMMVATVGAFGAGEYPEASAVMLFYQVGELFQSIAVGRSRKSISNLMDIRPDSATVIRDGEEITVSPDEVEVGELIVIRPGEKIPLDGIVEDGTSSVNTAALTGESAPVDVEYSDNVISGTVNLTGVLKVKTTSTFGESTVSKILELVENSSEKKAKVENFITKFARWYTPCVVIAALLLAVIPPVILGIGSWDVWKTWLVRACVFLVVSCPCALVVSVPLSFFGGIGGAAKEGILIKGANYMETLAEINTVVFDKTGTLTKGIFAVEDIHPNLISKEELLDLAAECESFSSHPVAQSIVRAHGGHIEKERIGEVKEIAGKGIEAVIDGKRYYCGNGGLMDMCGAEWHDCHLTGTIIHIAQDKEYLGHIVINDEMKEDSASAIAALKNIGVKRLVMLTGDKEKVAANVAEKLGLTEYHAELLPADKVTWVEKLLEQGGKLAFTGDGINDAPVLMRADLGIAMGAMGSDAAIESADVVLMDDKPTGIVKAVLIARKTMRIVKENVFFALFVKAVILVLGAVGIANMWLAVFGDVGVLILAILNAVRAMKTK